MFACLETPPVCAMAACSARLAVLSGAQGACVRLRRAPAAPHVGPALVVGVRHTAALLQRRAPALRRRSAPAVAASGAAAQPGPPVGGLSAEEKAHLATVAAKVASCAQRLKRASWLGFWSQLTLTVVSAVIIVFSIVFKGVTKACPMLTRYTPALLTGVAGHGRGSLLHPVRHRGRLSERLLDHGLPTLGRPTAQRSGPAGAGTAALAGAWSPVRTDSAAGERGSCVSLRRLTALAPGHPLAHQRRHNQHAGHGLHSRRPTGTLLRWRPAAAPC